MITLFSYAIFSFFLTFCTILYSYALNQQFYSTIINLTTSGLSLLIISNTTFCTIWLSCIITKKMLFGTLSDLEYEDWLSNIQYSIIETAFALAMFNDKGQGKVYVMLLLILEAKSFHWICESRLESMAQSPRIKLSTHIRFVIVILLFAFLDSCFIYSALSTFNKSEIKPTTVTFLGFEVFLLYFLVCIIVD